MAERTIVAAAILVNREVWTLPKPARHSHLVNVWSKVHWSVETGNARIGSHEQGFVDSKGNFVDRQEAARIAYEAGQIAKPKKTLYSEDLW